MKETVIPSAESDAWNIAESMTSGKPSLLRYRPGLKPFLGDARYTKLLSVALSYRETNSSGMPNELQTEQMRVIEDALQAGLDVDRAAVLAFVRTGSGSRTWYYYVSDAANLSERINQALEPGLPIQLAVAGDPEWRELRHIYALCGE